MMTKTWWLLERLKKGFVTAEYLTVIDGELHGVTLDPNQALKFNDRIEAEHYAPNAYEFANLDGIEFRAVEHEFMEAKIPQEASHD